MSVWQSLNATSVYTVCTCNLDTTSSLMYRQRPIIIKSHGLQICPQLLIYFRSFKLNLQEPKVRALDFSVFGEQWSAGQLKTQGSESSPLEHPSPALASLGEVFEMVLCPYRRMSNLIWIIWLQFLISDIKAYLIKKKLRTGCVLWYSFLLLSQISSMN